MVREINTLCPFAGLGGGLEGRPLEHVKFSHCNGAFRGEIHRLTFLVHNHRMITWTSNIFKVYEAEKFDHPKASTHSLYLIKPDQFLLSSGELPQKPATGYFGNLLQRPQDELESTFEPINQYLS